MVSLALIGVLFAMRPIAQDPAYHQFADQRTLLGIPNAMDVLSNLPFLVIGAVGLWIVVRDRAKPVVVEPQEKPPYLTLFFAVVLVAFGSGYYHLHPNNQTLVWDRLPMSSGFMALFTAVIAERFGVRWGRRLLPWLVIGGAASVVYWHIGELYGRGDLRPYVGVQFLPLLLIPLLIAFFPSRYTGSGYLFLALGCYGLAKLLETFDKPIYRWTGFISGHTLKHCMAAFAISWLVMMLRSRVPRETVPTFKQVAAGK